MLKNVLRIDQKRPPKKRKKKREDRFIKTESSVQYISYYFTPLLSPEPYFPHLKIGLHFL